MLDRAVHGSVRLKETGTAVCVISARQLFYLLIGRVARTGQTDGGEGIREQSHEMENTEKP